MSERVRALHVRLPNRSPTDGCSAVAAALASIIRAEGKRVDLLSGGQTLLYKNGPASPYVGANTAIVAAEELTAGWVTVHLTSSRGAELSDALQTHVIVADAEDALELELWEYGLPIDKYMSEGSSSGERRGKPYHWEDVLAVSASPKDLACVWNTTRRTHDASIRGC
jgi:hypothetical protein